MFLYNFYKKETVRQFDVISYVTQDFHDFLKAMHFKTLLNFLTKTDVLVFTHMF